MIYQAVVHASMARTHVRQRAKVKVLPLVFVVHQVQPILTYAAIVVINGHACRREGLKPALEKLKIGMLLMYGVMAIDGCHDQESTPHHRDERQESFPEVISGGVSFDRV